MSILQQIKKHYSMVVELIFYPRFFYEKNKDAILSDNGLADATLFAALNAGVSAAIVALMSYVFMDLFSAQRFIDLSEFLTTTFFPSAQSIVGSLKNKFSVMRHLVDWAWLYLPSAIVITVLGSFVYAGLFFLTLRGFASQYTQGMSYLTVAKVALLTSSVSYLGMLPILGNILYFIAVIYNVVCAFEVLYGVPRWRTTVICLLPYILIAIVALMAILLVVVAITIFGVNFLKVH